MQSHDVICNPIFHSIFLYIRQIFDVNETASFDNQSLKKERDRDRASNTLINESCFSMSKTKRKKNNT